MFIMKNILGC